MRHWPLPVLEHVAFGELPVLPFLAPRAFSRCTVSPRLPKPRRKSSVAPNEPTETSRSRCQPSKPNIKPSIALTRNATPRSRLLPTSQNHLVVSATSCFHTAGCHFQHAKPVEEFPQDAARPSSPSQKRSLGVSGLSVSQKSKPHELASSSNLRASLSDIEEQPKSDLQKDELPTASSIDLMRKPSQYSEHSKVKELASEVIPLSVTELPAKTTINPRFARYLRQNYAKPRTKQSKIRQNEASTEFSKPPGFKATSYRYLKSNVRRQWPLKAPFDVSNMECELGCNHSGGSEDHSSSIKSFSRTWKDNIAYMKETNSLKLHPRIRKGFASPLHSSVFVPGTFSTTASEILEEFPNLGKHDSENFASRWNQLSSEARSTNWPIVALGYLRKSSEAALEFINATKLNPPPAKYQISDLLDIAAIDVAKRGEANFYASLLQATKVVLESYSEPPDLSQRFIKKLLDYRTLQSMKAITIHDLMLHYKVKQHFHTKLHFANALANEQEHEAASSTFFDAVQSGADVRSVEVKKTAAKLLNELSSNNSYGAATKLIADFLAVSIELNIAMYNILIMKAFESNDPTTAWKIYDLVKHNGMDPDDFTYSIVLRGCRAANDIRKCEEIIMEIESLEDHVPSDFLLAEMLWDVYFFRDRNQDFDDRFNRVLRLYERYYSTLPLENLGLVTGKVDHNDRSSSMRMPTSRILGVMLFAYLRTAPRGMCAAVYQRFRQEVEDFRNPELIPLAAESFTYHSFMKRLADIRSPLWKRVFTDMSADLPKTVNKDTGKQFEPPGPTLEALNIVLHSYAKEANHAVAAQIFQLMERHGLKPDVVTYTSIVDMYARKQDVRMVAECLKIMEDQGVAANRITLQSIQRINDRPGLIEALRHIQQGVKELDTSNTRDVQ